MFGFFKRVIRPFATIGRKISNVFNIGRKAEPVIEVIKDADRFVDIAPRGLRNRIPTEVNVGQGFYPTMDDALRGYKYPN